MAGLVRLCLKAAPGYISSRGFHLTLTFSNYRTSFKHFFSTLFPLHFLPLKGFELDESRGLGYDPLIYKDSRSLLSLRRPPYLHYHYTHKVLFLILLHLSSSNS
jgi:hypothetical protein